MPPLTFNGSHSMVIEQSTEATPRIGEILVMKGLLTQEQVGHILQTQHRAGRPFGELAEQLYGIGPREVEDAWADQYLSYGTATDLRQQRICPHVLQVINRRQAWQFRVLPLHREDGEIVAATSHDRLRRAVTFAWRRFDEPVYFVIAQPQQLEDFLMTYYPWPNALTLSATG